MSQLFPAVILAGGLATRLRPLTETIPKALLDINGEPFIAHQLRLLKSKGISEVVICMGYLGEQVVSFVGKGENFGIKVVYSQDGNSLRGTAGAIKKAVPLLPESFFVLYGDSYLDTNYSAVQKTYELANKLALMTVYKNDNHWDKSNIEFFDGSIHLYDKQQLTSRMHYIDYGMGIFNKTVFNNVSENEPYDLADLYKQLLKQNDLAAHEVFQRFYEIGSLTGMEELKHYLQQQPQEVHV
jgi:MurNAc alpha-1-phosphate uridylyltransferase